MSTPSTVPRRAGGAAGADEAGVSCCADGANVATGLWTSASDCTGIDTMPGAESVTIGGTTARSTACVGAGRASVGKGGASAALFGAAASASSARSTPLSSAKDITVRPGASTRRLTCPTPRLSSAAINRPLTSSDAAAGPLMRNRCAALVIRQKLFATVNLKLCPSAASAERWRRYCLSKTLSTEIRNSNPLAAPLCGLKAKNRLWTV